MSSTSSINTVSNSGNKNYIAGLASGMDTESMVQSMLSGTQSKIDKQTGLKQQLEWKQDIYRSLITKINTFSDKYFSYYGSGDTNLMSSSLYNTMTGVSSSSNIKVTSVSGNAVSSMKIDSIDRLATACTVKTTGNVTGAPVGSGADLSQFTNGSTYSFSATLDGVNRTITFTAGADDTDTLKNINQALYRNFGTAVGMNYTSAPGNNNGTMELVQLDAAGNPTSNSVDSSRRVIIQSSGDADTVKNLGFGTGFSNKLDYGTSLKNMNFANKPQGGRYEFEINGVSIKGLTDNSTLSDVISAINNSDAGVKVSYSSAADKFIMESTSTGDISKISMSQTYGTLLTTMFGVEATGIQSSLFSKRMAGEKAEVLDSIRTDLNAGHDKKFVFQVDGNAVEIKLEGKSGANNYKTNQSVIDALNSQLDKKLGTGAVHFTIESENDAGTDVDTIILASKEHKISFVQDNLDNGIAGILGFSSGENNLLGAGNSLREAGFTGTMFINGSSLSESSKISDLVNALGNGAVYSADGRIEISGNTTISITAANDDGKAALKKLFGTENISIASVNGSITSNAALSVPGSGVINVKKHDGTVTSVDMSGSSPDNLDRLKNAIRAAIGGNVEFINNKLAITGGNQLATISGTDAATNQFIRELFGNDTYTFNPQMTAQITAGQNAKITVDGVTMERNTNTFELDGITMELTGTTGAGDPPISLTTSRDTDKIIDSLKSFVEDYNTLIEELNSYVAEEATYKKYAPLTDAQKKEMSDREIELWEEKSKKGLLHNDSNVSSFLSDMRMVLYSSVEDAGLALYDIGIETSDNWRDNGKLIIDEETLKSMVATNAENIRKLFTDKEQGVAVKLQEAIKEAANVSSGSPGSMVRYAGTKDVLITSNTIYDEMKRISETLSKLNTKYELERTRYWKQFNAMEQAISNMNSQSSWLTQQFSS